MRITSCRKCGTPMARAGWVFVLAVGAAWPTNAWSQDRTGPAGGPDAQAVARLEQLSDAFASIAAAVKPTVVNISSVATNRRLNRELREAFPDGAFQFSPVTGTGSGVIFDADGFIVTNNHVVAGADAVRVTLADGRKLRAEVVATDPKTDLAVIRINAKGLKAARFGDSDAVRVGHIVLAIGSPFRLGHSVSHGIVSAIGRNDDIDVDIDYKNWIQTDAPINPGNSGGPLISARGEIVGINVAIATDSGGHQGVGFAIPSNTVRRIANMLKTGEKVVRGYLGVEIDPVDEQTASGYGLSEVAGVMIRGVGEDSPAARGGLKSEDIVLAIDGTPVRTREQLQQIIAETSPGSSVSLKVWRKSREQTVRVTVEEQPRNFRTTISLRELTRQREPDSAVEAAPSEGNSDDEESAEDEGATSEKGDDSVGSADDGDAEDHVAPGEGSRGREGTESAWGFEGATLTPELGRKYRLPSSLEDGVLITSVDPASEAWACRLRRGMVIVRANDKPVRLLDDLTSALNPEALARGVRLKLRDRSDEYYLVLRVRP